MKQVFIFDLRMRNGKKYSRLDLVDFLKAVFHKIYLVPSWMYIRILLNI